MSLSILRANERNYMCRLQEVMIYGYEAIIMENELIRVMIIVGKGCEIAEFNYKPLDIDFVLRTGIGLKALKYYQRNYNDDLNIYDYYTGSWFDTFPNCGEAGILSGTKIPTYGEVYYLPWEYKIIKDTRKKIILKTGCRLLRSPFYFEKTFTINSGEAALYVDQKIQNISEKSSYYNIGFHPNFGKNFMSEDTVIDYEDCNISIPVEGESSRFNINESGSWPYIKDKNRKVVDLRTIPNISSNISDFICLQNFEKGSMFLKNRRNSITFRMNWDKKVFNNILLWISTAGYSQQHYKEEYLLCNFIKNSKYLKLKDSIKNKDIKKLKPNETINTWMSFMVESI